MSAWNFEFRNSPAYSCCDLKWSLNLVWPSLPNKVIGCIWSSRLLPDSLRSCAHLRAVHTRVSSLITSASCIYLFYGGVACAMVHVWRSCGSWGANSSSQSWREMPLCAGATCCSCTIFLKAGLSLNLELIDWLDWLASKHQAYLTVFASAPLGITWVLGIWTWALMLACQARSWLHHFPCRSLIFLKSKQLPLNVFLLKKKKRLILFLLSLLAKMALACL